MARVVTRPKESDLVDALLSAIDSSDSLEMFGQTVSHPQFAQAPTTEGQPPATHVQEQYIGRRPKPRITQVQSPPAGIAQTPGPTGAVRSPRRNVEVQKPPTHRELGVEVNIPSRNVPMGTVHTPTGKDVGAEIYDPREKRPGSQSLYDYKNAEAAGLKPDETGHWPSRVPSGPNEGLILKLPGHPTLDKTRKGEKEAGYEIIERGGRLWSFPKGDPRLAPQSSTPEATEPTSRMDDWMQNRRVMSPRDITTWGRQQIGDTLSGTANLIDPKPGGPFGRSWLASGMEAVGEAIKPSEEQLKQFAERHPGTASPMGMFATGIVVNPEGAAIGAASKLAAALKSVRGTALEGKLVEALQRAAGELGEKTKDPIRWVVDKLNTMKAEEVPAFFEKVRAGLTDDLGRTPDKLQGLSGFFDSLSRTLFPPTKQATRTNVGGTRTASGRWLTTESDKPVHVLEAEALADVQRTENPFGRRQRTPEHQAEELSGYEQSKLQQRTRTRMATEENLAAQGRAVREREASRLKSQEKPKLEVEFVDPALQGGRGRPTQEQVNRARLRRELTARFELSAASQREGRKRAEIMMEKLDPEERALLEAILAEKDKAR